MDHRLKNIVDCRITQNILKILALTCKQNTPKCVQFHAEHLVYSHFLPICDGSRAVLIETDVRHGSKSLENLLSVGGMYKKFA